MSSLYRRLRDLFLTKKRYEPATGVTKANTTGTTNELKLGKTVEKFNKYFETPEFRAHRDRYMKLLSRFDSGNMIHEFVEHQKKVDEMRQLNCPRTVSSLNALLSACVNSREFTKIKEIYGELAPKLGIELDRVSYNIVINAFYEMDDLDSVLSVLNKMEKSGMRPDGITCNTLLDAFYRSGRFADGEMWDLMESKNIFLKVMSYTARTRGLVFENRPQEAFKMCKKIINRGWYVQPYLLQLVVDGLIKESRIEDARMLLKLASLRHHDSRGITGRTKQTVDIPDTNYERLVLQDVLQRIALSWMVQKETSSRLCSGGILADDQGLGKTITMIALILNERPPPRSQSDDVNKEELEILDLDDDEVCVLDGMRPNAHHSTVLSKYNEFNKMNCVEKSKGRPAGGTLIVCPTSILRQRSEELRNKVTAEAKLSVCVYHGSDRTNDPNELAGYDVVVTTFSVVAREVPKQPLVEGEDDENKEAEGNGVTLESVAGPLAMVEWDRVALDEGQKIKNHRTQVARACWGLRAKLHESFLSTLKSPIYTDPAKGYKKLQSVLKTIMLRRTKGTLLDGEPIISLPLKLVEHIRVDFTTEERDFYSSFEGDSRAKFKKYADAGTVKQNYEDILTMLLRLRQFCDHPLLATGLDSISMRRFSIEMAKKIPRDKQISLLSCMSNKPGQGQSCDGRCTEPVNGLECCEWSPYDSSKIKAALEIIQSVGALGQKVLVYSQWTKMLDLIETRLNKSSIQYRRLDGTMSVDARDEAVKDFDTHPEFTVMLVSLNAGSLGLNLVAASYVVLLDPWWNPTTEDQAIARAHRIGQTRPVKGFRLTVRDTVEDRVLALQEKKREMVANAIGEDETGCLQTRLTEEDLRYLFMA